MAPGETNAARNAGGPAAGAADAACGKNAARAEITARRQTFRADLPGAGFSQAARERAALVPRISRARDWRLYTAEGRRIVDLWQYGGRAVLGHKPAGLVRELKNAAERGLFAPFPSHLEGRFLKALSALFPGRVFRVYPDDAALECGLARAAASFQAGPFPAVKTWLPFSGGGPAVPDALPELFVPVLPLPLAGSPAVLALEPALAARFFPGNGGGETPVDAAPGASPPPETAAGERRAEKRQMEAGSGAAFPAGPLSPAVLAPAIRAVYDLVSAPARSLKPFPELRRALERGAAREFWKCQGIHLSRRAASDGAEAGEAGWTALFTRFLEGGFLLPPERDAPVILPGALSPGEEAKLAALLSTP